MARRHWQWAALGSTAAQVRALGHLDARQGSGHGAGHRCGSRKGHGTLGSSGSAGTRLGSLDG